MRRQQQPPRSTNGDVDVPPEEYEKADKPGRGSNGLHQKILLIMLSGTVTWYLFALSPTQVDEDQFTLLVHLGRTGGMSIRQQTAAGCLDEEDLDKRRKCFRQYDGTKLASQTKQVLHFDSINPHDFDVVEKASRFLVTMRNPLDRAMAAYRAAHPEISGIPPQHHHADFLFTTCFPSPMNLENLCQAILPNYNVPHFAKDQKLTVQQKCDCRALAR